MTARPAGALTATLSAQHAGYQALHALAAAQADAIGEADVARLTEVTAEQERLLEHLAALELERRTHTAALAAAVGLPEPGVVLTDLAARLLPDESGPLLTAGVALRRTAEEAQLAMARNRALLHESAALIEQWLRYVRHALARARGGVGYRPGGEQAPGDGAARVFDRSA